MLQTIPSSSPSMSVLPNKTLSEVLSLPKSDNSGKVLLFFMCTFFVCIANQVYKFIENLSVIAVIA